MLVAQLEALVLRLRAAHLLDVRVALLRGHEVRAVHARLSAPSLEREALRLRRASASRPGGRRGSSCAPRASSRPATACGRRRAPPGSSTGWRTGAAAGRCGAAGGLLCGCGEGGNAGREGNRSGGDSVRRRVIRISSGRSIDRAISPHAASPPFGPRASRVTRCCAERTLTPQNVRPIPSLVGLPKT